MSQCTCDWVSVEASRLVHTSTLSRPSTGGRRGCERPVGALAADQLTFDHRYPPAGRQQFACGGLTACSHADDDHIELIHLGRAGLLARLMRAGRSPVTLNLPFKWKVKGRE